MRTRVFGSTLPLDVLDKVWDVADVGGGVVGTAKFWARSRYTNFKSMILIEKFPGPGQLNSAKDKNSQTLHFGDIEANYVLDKALHVREAGMMVYNYARMFGIEVFQRMNKLLLAVGSHEISELKKRYHDFKARYKGIELLNRSQINDIEPKVIEGRDPNEEVMAIRSSDGHAISFQALSESFVENAMKSDKEAFVAYETKVIKIKRVDGIYHIVTNRGTIKARMINVAAGAHSLLFAHSLGYGKQFTLLAIAGSFWLTIKKVLNGKVYTMQDPDIPFAAPHGDPPFNKPDETRFGPTAKLIPFLERHSPRTFFDFLRVLPRTLNGWVGLLSTTLLNRRLSIFMFKNLFYDLPIIGRWLYLQQIKKIVPTMRYRDLRFGKGIGGLRPQMIDVISRKVIFGLHLILGDKAIFNVAPSPGGSACLQNAKENLRKEVEFAGEGYYFDEEKFAEELERDFYSGAAA